MSELERLPDKESKRWSDAQRDYNISSKRISRIIGTNITSFVCLLLPILLIGFIWTDFGTPQVGLKLVSDGIVTVALFIIGETMMMRVGSSGGMLDAEYLSARKEFDSLVSSVNEVGTMLMSVFCEWQIDSEMKQATAIRLRYLRITQSEWEKVKDMKFSELRKKYGFKKARKIRELNRLEPMELNDAMLLFNNNDAMCRGGVPISGEEYIYKKTHSVGMLLSTLFTGLLTVSVAITFTNDVSFSRVMYTAFKLIVLLYRMAEGYDIGARAYNTVELHQLKAKNTYLRQYIVFVKDKTYLKLGNKYGETGFLVSKDEPMSEQTETTTND